MISFDEASALLVAGVRPCGVETLELADARECVLAAPVLARLDSPRADVSGMDGYAVREADLAQFPARIHVVAEALPGRKPVPLEPGTCARIFTGAPVPAGADRVVIQEEIRRVGDIAHLSMPAGPSRYIRRKAADFSEGDELLPSGTLLTPQAILAAGAADVSHVETYRKPRLKLVATGDELVEPGSALEREGAIPESVSLGVASLATRWGATVTERIIAADDLATLRRTAERVTAGADLVVVTGGASVGERDFGKAMFGDRLQLRFSKIAIKPGKPVWFGRAGSTPVLGLPGNPTSALVTARLFLAPLLAGMTGRPPSAALAWRRAPTADEVPGAGSRETFSRGIWDGDVVRLVPDQESFAQRALVRAGLLIRRPAGNAGFAAGEQVQVLDF